MRLSIANRQPSRETPASPYIPPSDWRLQQPVGAKDGPGIPNPTIGVA